MPEYMPFPFFEDKHRCFWPDCPWNIPVSFLGCDEHYQKLPHEIRLAWIRHDIDPSRYADVRRLARDFAFIMGAEETKLWPGY